jgi:hypothetical protein
MCICVNGINFDCFYEFFFDFRISAKVWVFFVFYCFASFQWSFPFIDWLLNLKPTHNVPYEDIAPAVNIFEFTVVQNTGEA